MAVIALMIGLCAVLAPATARAETRTLKLYNTHTGERDQITFKRNGSYVRGGLNQLNRFLRDHRRNEPTRMDPELFDLVWEVYKASGARDYIHVVSGYRSPATNQMLRRTRGGQAKKSQHMVGKAMDFFIPGVSASRLRELGFKLQGGGVGYYPKSASPYVHLDTGNVRAWPRMSRSQLTRLFPDGKTLHLPPDGRRLPGYQQALAAYNARQRSGQPPSFGRSRGGSGSGGGGNGGGLLANLFGGGGGGSDDEPSSPRAQSASRSSAPAARRQPPETPATILAALPSRSMPRPGAAPRAGLRQGVPVAANTPQASASAAPQAPDTPPASTGLLGLRLPTPRAIIPGLDVGDQRPAEARAPAPQPEPTPAPEPTPQPAPASGPAVLLAELTPPVPQRRPTVLVAAAEAPAERRSADQIEASATIATAAGSDDAAALLAAADATPENAEPTQLALAMPVPSPRPEPQRTDQVPTTLAAYAPPPAAPVEPMVAPVAPDPALRADAAAEPAPSGRGGRVTVPAPRPERGADDAVMTAALDTGVRTTAKAGRPSARDAVTVAPPRVPVVPAEQIDPARFGDWTVTVASVTASGRPTERPQFIKNATRSAPDTVYTAGFAKTAPPDPSRLSGNAVTFLTVSRFGTTGGDGQPLQLQIPATN